MAETPGKEGASANTEQLPTREQCLALLRGHKANGRLITHSEKVAEVACYLARKLKEKGEHIDLALVEAGALLHDIGRALGETEVHHDLGCKLLEPKWPALAEVVCVHIPQAITPPNSLPNWEAKLVYYADKRVRWAEIVSLKERFDDLKERYGRHNPGLMKIISDAEKPTEALEKEIFNKIDADVSLEKLKRAGAGD